MAETTPFKKVLVANRGEIACRVIRTANAAGYRTVAVYSEADTGAPHTLLADEAVFIGESPASASYLNIDAILEAAARTQADAVHPGYGFLSENAEFARRCEDADICFIGPPPAAIELMGSKRLSKIAMQEAEVPCIPGYEEADQDIETLLKAADAIGFPVMIKASAGGGGRGMRLVRQRDAFIKEAKTARSEAQNAFGSGELILEKALVDARHIEIQVFADQHGNALYLGERDCSIQRRHQKVVEEAPSPFVSPKLRQAMGEAAVQAALACHYVGAGTVEFLVDQEEHFYFLEMNTRLQVEHPVTEMITGIDLVSWQLDVAAGLPLPITQEDVALEGHAIEVRLYAEDPTQDFMPQTGEVTRWRPADGEGIRIDAGIREGQKVSAFYDPMLAKIVAYGRHREEARRRLVKALENTQLAGVTHNLRYLRDILEHSQFASGQATTAFIADYFGEYQPLHKSSEYPELLALAAVLIYQRGAIPSAEGLGSGDRPDALSFQEKDWYSAQRAPVELKVALGDSVTLVRLEKVAADAFILKLPSVGDADEKQNCPESTEIALQILDWSAEQVRYRLGGIDRRTTIAKLASDILLQHDGESLLFRDMTLAPKAGTSAEGSGRIRAPMDGAIVEVLVENGQPVQQGDTLLILEAMKMEHPLKADRSGTVQLQAQPGQQVKVRQDLAMIAVLEESGDEKTEPLSETG